MTTVKATSAWMPYYGIAKKVESGFSQWNPVKEQEAMSKKTSNNEWSNVTDYLEVFFGTLDLGISFLTSIQNLTG